MKYSLQFWADDNYKYLRAEFPDCAIDFEYETEEELSAAEELITYLNNAHHNCGYSCKQIGADMVGATFLSLVR